MPFTQEMLLGTLIRQRAEGSFQRTVVLDGVSEFLWLLIHLFIHSCNSDIVDVYSSPGAMFSAGGTKYE